MNRILVIATLVLGMGALVAADAAAAPRGKKGKRPSRTATERPVARPTPRPVIRPVPKPVVRPAPRPVIRPAPKPVIRPAPRPVVRPAPRPVVRPAPRPVVRPAPAPRVMHRISQKQLDLARAADLESQAAGLARKAREYEQDRMTLLARAEALRAQARRAALHHRGTYRTERGRHNRVQALLHQANVLYMQAASLAAARDANLAQARALRARAQALRASHVVLTTRDFTWRTR